MFCSEQDTLFITYPVEGERDSCFVSVLSARLSPVSVVSIHPDPLLDLAPTQICTVLQSDCISLMTVVL